MSVVARRRSWALWVAVMWVLGGTQALADFSTVRNIPPEPNIGNNQSIGSDTQLNLAAGGAIGTDFQAGASDGSSTNVELNMSGGAVSDRLRANGGSVVNINGGQVGSSFRANNGSVVNINGGSIGIGMTALNGSTVNFRGGTVGVLFRAGVDSQLNIFGGDFYSGGVPVPGTESVGSAVVFNVPINSTLNGTLSDGTPFAFSTGNFLTDNIGNTTLTLHRTNLPPVGPATIHVDSAASLPGIRGGQTLVVESGGVVQNDFSAGRGSTISALPGGVVGDQLEMVAATLNVEGGQVGALSAFDGSVINISSGVAGAIRAYQGSVVNLIGGRIGSRDGSNYFVSSTVNFMGGDYPGGYSVHDSVLNFSGGREAFASGRGEIVGLSRFHVFGNSQLQVIGTQFLVDGAPIAGLTPGVPLTITERDVRLTGTYRNGNAFQFELNESDIGGEDFLGSEVIVTVLLVPEPGTLALVALAIACAGMASR